jgi:cell division protein FtsI (penicillin-binding protein 3)
LPANRGRILDRNGADPGIQHSGAQHLGHSRRRERDKAQAASSWPSCWTCQLADLQEVRGRRQDLRLAQAPGGRVGGQADHALNIKGIYQRKEYKRQYPEGEAAAHVVGFTNVEDKGQEGVELTFNKELAGRNGSRRVIKDRMGQVVEDVGDQIATGGRRDLQLSIDSKVQFFAYQKLRDAVLEHKAKAGSVVVLDGVTGEVLALANYPSYVPDKRRNLSGEQLRNRALTDTFEPGSTMKPFHDRDGPGGRRVSRPRP